MEENLGLSKIISSIVCPVCNIHLCGSSGRIARFENDGVVIVQIICPNCSKCFSLGFFGLDSNEAKILLYSKMQTKPITYDEILDFHKSMPDFEKKLHAYLKEHKL